MQRSREGRTTRQLAKYELLAKIATGGMAEIHVARTQNSSFERFCVVKKLLPQHAANEDYIKMFLNEGRIAALLSHPNIVQTYDFGSDNGAHYLAMEYLHGEDVRTMLRVLRAHGRVMPREHTLQIIISVCAALRHAHEARGPSGQPLELVHRDVTPHNVIVTYEGGVKLVDFGIAKSADRSWETKHGLVKGKVPYMSPEQVKGRRVDRRSDIYAVGVMLYELVVGRRPYVPSGNEFLLAMAIARHEVRPPSAFDPKIPSALERIIMTAIAYEPSARYQSARDLQADLETFARTERLNVSSLSLSAFMDQLFGAKVEAWRAAQHSPRELVAHVVQRQEERAHEDSSIDSEDGVGDPENMVPNAEQGHSPSPAALFASTSAPVASVAEIAGITVVVFQGKIDESFEGPALARSLSGVVLFDLAGVERITSFGVREWLEMMRGIENAADVSEVYLARCSEPIVMQMSLIRAFAGRAKVVSFRAPFLCDDCGYGFERTVDCEQDAELLLSSRTPEVACPRCGGSAKLDDDPGYLTFAHPFAGQPAPENVREILTRLVQSERKGAEMVEKLVTANETRLRVHRDPGASFRWNRVLDGIEGKVVIDFHGVSRLPREGATSFVRAVRALGAEVTSCRLVECPVAIVEALGSAAWNSQGGRLEVESIAFEGRCSACAAVRAGVLAVQELRDALSEKRDPVAPCRRCNGPLDLSAVEVARGVLLRSPPPHPQEAAPEPLSGRTADTPAEVPVVREEPPRARVGIPHSSLALGAPLIVAAVMVAGTLAMFVATRTRSEYRFSSVTASTGPPPMGLATSMSAPAPAVSEDVPDPGEPREVERGVDGIYVSASARAANEDAALSHVRALATTRLVAELLLDIPGPVREAIGRASPATDDPTKIAARFTEQVGAFASPERVDVRVRNEGAETVISARYRISSGAWEEARAYYGGTKEMGGAILANTYPTLAEGLLVVEGKRLRGVTHGSVLKTIDGRPATSLDALSKLPPGRHDARLATPLGNSIDVKLQSK